MKKSNPILRNILANYASQIYVIVMSLALIPWYVGYMGLEAFGLISFFAMAQTWMTFFDLGFGPTFARYASKFKAGKISTGSLTLLLRTIESSFVAIGLCIVLVCWRFGDWVALNWLKLDAINPNDVSVCVLLVGMMFTLRLASGVYRNGLLGLENQLQASLLLVVITTLRSALALVVLAYISTTVVAFFAFQLVAAVIETALLRIALKKSLPNEKCDRYQYANMREPMHFAISTAFLALVWIATSQVDKLILSFLLPLPEYAGFMLATTVAFGVFSLISPLQQAILPRLVILSEQELHDQFVKLYRLATQVMVAILAGVAGVIVAYPEAVLYTWTGDRAVSQSVSATLKWYAAGTSFMSIAGMSYILQSARGNLALHLKGSALSLLFLIPSLIFSAIHFGAVGASIAWMTVNFTFLIFWTSIVHRIFLPDLTLRWLAFDVAPGLAFAVLIVICAQYASWPFSSRAISLVALVLLTSGIIMLVLLMHIETRTLLFYHTRNTFRSLCAPKN